MNDDKEIGIIIVPEPMDKIDFIDHVQLIGHVGHGRTRALLERVIAENPGIVIIDLPQEIDAIEEIVERRRNPFYLEPYLIKPMPVFELEDFSPRIRQLDPSININREYNLIKEKQSKLSRWERDEVIRMYENNIPG